MPATSVVEQDEQQDNIIDDISNVEVNKSDIVDPKVLASLKAKSQVKQGESKW
jgi:hypothetical protein